MLKSVCSGLFVLALAALPTLASAQAPPGTEKIGLRGRRGESLLRPGFAVGDYVGGSRVVASNVSISTADIFSKDVTKAEFNVTGPGWAAPVTAICGGGQKRWGFGWATFSEDPVSYSCLFPSGAPSDARLGLALSQGTWRGRLQQPQRAGELLWNGTTIRFETKRIGGLPIGGGRVMGYVFRKGDQEIGGLDLNGIGPTFYLPPKGSPDRDAVLVAALAVYFFQDPANRTGGMTMGN